jgi:hypothetical protein
MMSDLIGVIEKRCEGTRELPDLIDTIVKVHIDFFSSRWDDFVLYFQGRADLQLVESYSGIEMPFLRYLESIEKLVDSVIDYRLPSSLLRRFESLMNMRGAFVSSLTRFINEALSADGARRLSEEASEENEGKLPG